VVGIDNSPLAVKTAQLRGVQDARVIPITRVSRNVLGQFETMIMFGNNFGLFGNAKRAKWLLRRFYKMTLALSSLEGSPQHSESRWLELPVSLLVLLSRTDYCRGWR
jgi:hypothetical protein